MPDRRIAQLTESASSYLETPVGIETYETWYGWGPMTWDSLPIVGRAPGLDNALLATGHNMLGVALAAGTGRLIRELVEHQPTHIGGERIDGPTTFKLLDRPSSGSATDWHKASPTGVPQRLSLPTAWKRCRSSRATR